MRAFVVGAIAALSLVATAVPASAAIVLVTYSGTATGRDNLGYFGQAGELYRNTAFTATIQFDSTLGTRTTNEFYDDLQVGEPTAGIAAALTLNGQTFNFSQIDYFQQLTDFVSDVFGTQVGNWDQVGNKGSSQTMSFGLSLMPVPSTIDVPAHYEGSFGCCTSAMFSENIGSIYVQSEFAFDTNIIDVKVTGPVPEPSTWELMILGFGSAGAMLRRRSSLATPD